MNIGNQKIGISNSTHMFFTKGYFQSLYFDTGCNFQTSFMTNSLFLIPYVNHVLNIKHKMFLGHMLGWRFDALKEWIKLFTYRRIHTSISVISSRIINFWAFMTISMKYVVVKFGVKIIASFSIQRVLFISTCKIIKHCFWRSC